MSDATARGFNAPRLVRLDAFARATVERGRAPGFAALVWRRGGIATLVVEGLADVAREIPFARDSIVRIASMTKPVVSVAALMLVERGLLALDEPIARWLPEAAGLRVLRHPAAALDDTEPLERAPTLYDLVTHRAGFTGSLGLPSPLTLAVRDAAGGGPFIDRAPDDYVARVMALPLMLQPGRHWHYGIATDLLGIVLARAAGRSLPDLLHEEIFAPLGMVDTGFHAPGDAAARLAVGYARRPDGRLVVYDDPALGRWSAPPLFPSGGGGLLSTLDDYLRFARLLLEGGALEGTRLLSRHGVAALTAGHLSDAQRRPALPAMDILDGRNFGLGVAVRDRPAADLGSRGSYGWSGVYGTDWFNDPREELTAILLTQVWLGGNDLRNRFANLVYQALD